MKEILPEKLVNFARICGFPLYVVGGTCRDFLAGFSVNRDFDVCAPVSADRFVSAAESRGFTVRSVYAHTGTVKLSCDGEEYEFASFRTDEYTRGHAPDRTCFTDDIVKDALRRDFKCNAVYYDIAGERFVDPLGGIADIRAHRVDCTRAAENVFGEDGLRLMRLCRLCAQTGFAPSSACMAGAKANAFRIREISPERIWAELNAVLHADGRNGIKGAQYAGLELLSESGVLDFILPELTAGRGMEQRSDYHKYDVLEHSLRCVMYAADDIRLAALLHDAGKPYCKIKNGNFYGHETEGARIAGEICARLKISSAQTRLACRLTALHMYDLGGKARESKIRRLIVSNADIWRQLLELKQADYSACRDDTAVAPCVMRWREVYGKMEKEGVPFTVKQLAVRGDELIAAGIPAEKAGKTLSALLCECAVGKLENRREKLLLRAAALSDRM